MGIQIKPFLGHYSANFESNGGSEGMAGKTNVLSPVFPRHLFSNPDGFIKTGNLLYLLEDNIEIVPEVGDDVCR